LFGLNHFICASQKRSYTMSAHHYIAIDLGAESGRVMLGALADGKISLEEIHRFPNGPVITNGEWHWDVVRLFDEIKMGLRKVAERGVKVDSISADSWGVDYVLLRDDGTRLAAPFHYRDKRTDGGFERAFAVVPREEIFRETGIQFMTLNTLYQLHSDLRQRREVLESAELFLTMGDYFNFLLCGARVIEESLASTTQLYNPQKRAWSEPLIKKFGFPKKIFPKVVPSGTKLGALLPAVASDTGLKNARVVASCSHDTGAAVAAVPAERSPRRKEGDSASSRRQLRDDWAYLSSGTWSLLGIETSKPIITEKSLKYNFTNEIGFGGSIRFLKNIIGLWILQECRREWVKQGREYDYAQMTKIAESAPPLRSLINPNDERFGKPDAMPKKVADFCRETKQTPPKSDGEYVRCVLESLALLYRATLERLEDVTGKKIATLHIVGGGSKNELLNQFTANATGRIVLAGPVECTAAGNVLVQAIALGHLKSLAEAREVVRQSFEIRRYEPQDQQRWTSAIARFSALLQGW
jgi:rhamnulokinase